LAPAGDGLERPSYKTPRAVAAATLIAHCSLLPAGEFSGTLVKGSKNVIQANDKTFDMVYDKVCRREVSGGTRQGSDDLCSLFAWSLA
jgi:hypothetical protein